MGRAAARIILSCDSACRRADRYKERHRSQAASNCLDAWLRESSSQRELCQSVAFNSSCMEANTLSARFEARSLADWDWIESRVPSTNSSVGAGPSIFRMSLRELPSQ